IAGASLFLLIIGHYKQPKLFNYVIAFLGASLFSYMLLFVIFKDNRVYIGGLYLLRLFVYSSFFLLAWNINRSEKGFKEILFNSLILITFAVAVFGWLQYFLYPDVRNFVVWGWDDHLYRLFSTFLDPGFASIILVFGFLAGLTKYLHSKSRLLLIVLVILLGAAVFTYSRAGYLALAGGLFTLAFLKKRLKQFFLVLGTILLIIILLPRPSGEGVKLERTFSIYSRLGNYSETLEIIQKSPLLGVGFNNMCLAREKYLKDADFSSHSCSGSDSSLLLVLATTGIVGFLIFSTLIYKVTLNLGKNVYANAFLACLVALLIHSLFVNSLFYPWVMGWMALMLSISLKEIKE
ncbi:MAG: O-antigen ligase family protein, partial [Microgenomates group bacterium]